MSIYSASAVLAFTFCNSWIHSSFNFLINISSIQCFSLYTFAVRATLTIVTAIANITNAAIAFICFIAATIACYWTWATVNTITTIYATFRFNLTFLNIIKLNQRIDLNHLALDCGLNFCFRFILKNTKAAKAATTPTVAACAEYFSTRNNGLDNM